jgi:aspartate kinase
LEQLKDYHQLIIDELNLNDGVTVAIVSGLFDELNIDLQHPNQFKSTAAFYDKIVSYGERLSSRIIHAALLTNNLNSKWINASEYIITDTVFKEAKVNWPVTNDIIKGLIPIIKEQIILTQGFIGGTPKGEYTTLGREGSDFSAAIFASCLNADTVTIWKDVPGILNADPKIIPHAIKFDQLNYREAAEMTYYGASVIHPKTIKPLANKNIPLLVNSFEQPNETGTIIGSQPPSFHVPAIIFKSGQDLITFKVKDFTFINESNLSIIFHLMATLNIKINMMQNSAISLSVCIDSISEKNAQLIATLKNDFIVEHVEGLTLITIKNYSEETINEIAKDKEILLEQKTTANYQIVVR